MPKNKASYIISELNMSLASEEDMEKICVVLKKFDITFFKISGGNRLTLTEIAESNIENLRNELFQIIPHAPAIGVNYVHSCPGLHSCKYATGNAQQLGRRIEKISFDSPPPAKIKVSIAGCKICCTEPYLRDIGIIGSRSGWTFVFGGNGGGKPRIGDIIAEGLDDDQVLEMIHSCISAYGKMASPRHRTARFIEQIGIEKFKKII